MKKNIIIDGDKFQKEYKRQLKKESITEIIQGILLMIIAIAGLFFGSKLLLKLIIYIVPLFILTYAINLLTMGITIFKSNRNQALSFFLQSFIFVIFAIYIFLNPIDTLGFVLVILGILILINAIIKMFYFPNYFPISSLIGGTLLIIFSDTLIDLFYTIVMIFLLFYGAGKIGKAIYNIRNDEKI